LSVPALALYIAGAQGRFNRGALTQAGIFVALSTLALTASFLGLVALVTGTVTGSNTRLPMYVLGTALAFVGAILLFEEEYRAGRRVLETAAAVAVGTLVLLLFGGEGVAYLLQQPDRVASSQSLFYLLAAGLIGTGLGYWGLHHWREVARSRGM
jgi:hypothetical protein